MSAQDVLVNAVCFTVVAMAIVGDAELASFSRADVGIECVAAFLCAAVVASVFAWVMGRLNRRVA